MNKVLLLFLVIALFACKNKEKSTSTETEKPIKTATDVVENSQPTARKVDFSVRVIRPYCGGAAPSEEMEQMRMKGEMANKFVFYQVYSGPFLEDQPQPPYTLISKSCGDCTAIGSNVKPTFWIE